MIIWQLLFSFLKIGIFTFGGGYAMIALIKNEVVEQHAWLTAQEFTDLLALSQVTPGPIGINAATYTGFSVALNAGYSYPISILVSLLCSLAVLLLPVTLMMLVCRFLRRYQHHQLVQWILQLLRLSVVGLIASAALTLLTVDNFGSPTTERRQFIISILLFLIAFVVSVIPRNHIQRPWLRRLTNPISIMVIASLAGMLLY